MAAVCTNFEIEGTGVIGGLLDGLFTFMGDFITGLLFVLEADGLAVLRQAVEAIRGLREITVHGKIIILAITS